VRESSDNSVADSTYLEALLRRPVTDTPVDPLAATRQAGGVRLGTLKRFDGQGRAYVQIDGQPQPQICAGALVALQAQDIGRRVALGFAGGETQNPIILGLLHEAPGAVQISSPQPVSIEQKGKRTIIQASGEMELRCGEAVILMQADGRIQLRGTYITSHASAGQRIRGGSVQIN
jgi:hypothetical protein